VKFVGGHRPAQNLDLSRAEASGRVAQSNKSRGNLSFVTVEAVGCYPLPLKRLEIAW